MSEQIRAVILAEGWRGDDADAMLKQVIRRRDDLNKHGGQKCVLCHTVKGVSAFDVDADEYNGLNRCCVDCQGD